MKEQESLRSKIMQSGKPGLLFRMPHTYFRIKLAKQDKRFNAFLLGISGMVMGLSFAQLLGLGAHYQTGQIISGILILGPLLGLIHFGFSAIVAKWIGNALSPAMKPSFKLHLGLPPFPLKKMFWLRILGPKKLLNLFQLPVLKQYRLIWARISSGASWLWEWLETGKPGTKVLSSLSVDAARPLAYVAPLTWIGLFWLGNDQFGRPSESSAIAVVLLAIQLLALLLGGYFWILALRTAYHFSWTKAIITALISWLLGLSIVYFAMSNLFGIQLN